MKVPLLDLKQQYASIRGEIREAMERVLESQHFILGPEVEALEREIADYSHTQHAVGVSSGTDAILVALMALRASAGDEIVTTPLTFIATAGSISRLGAKPVFVDVDPETFNLDAARLEDAITSRTRAIMPVHLFGQLADMDAIGEIARHRRIPIIEDAAQAIGAEWHGHRPATVGDLATLSFFPSKNLGAFGDGGMVISNDPELSQRVRLLRNQGQAPKYFSKEVGGNFRLDALQAAVLRAKLPHLDRWTSARQKNAQHYRELFAAAGLAMEGDVAGRPGVILPKQSPDVRHIYNQFVIRVDRRDALRGFLAENGIGSEVYYPQPMHLQECFKHLGYGPGTFPQSELAAAQSLAIPIYPELTSEMQQHVVATISRFFASP